MRVKHLFTILFLTCFVLTPVWAESAAKELEKAWASEDSQKASAIYAPGIWETEEDGGYGLFRQLVRKNMEFRLVREHSQDNRVVAIYDVWRKEHRVDRVYTFFVDDKVWAHTENKSHAVYFYQGKVPPRLKLTDITGTAELDNLGRRYLKGESTGRAKLDKALKNGDFELTSSHLLKDLGRALLVYGEQEYALVLERDGKNWKAVDYTYGPDATDLLPKVQFHLILRD